MYSINKTIYYSDLDPNAYLSIRALLNAYQDCCTQQTKDIGYDITWFMENQKGWFVTSYQMQMYRMPRMGETITVKTAPVNIRKFIGTRLFFVEDEAGEIISEAISEWVFMDAAKGRPGVVPTEMIEGYGIQDIPHDKWGSHKIAIPDGLKEINRFTVDYAYLDTNRHMNNAYYVEAAAESLGIRSYDRIRTEFKKSAVLSDLIIVKSAAGEGGVVVTLENEAGEFYCVVEFSGECHEG